MKLFSIIILMIAVMGCIASYTLTETVYYQQEEEVTLIKIEGEATPELMMKIYQIAEKYGVDPELMTEVINCESRFRNVQSRQYHKGVREKSYGLSQIHLPSHPEITKEQAKNSDFAIEFMAKEFSKGRYYKWNCYKKI